MKITTKDGTVFEGTQSEYEEFLAFAERKLVEQMTQDEKVETKYVPQEGDIVVVTANEYGSRNSVGDIGKITEVLSYKIVVDVPSKTEGLGGFGNGHRENEVRKATIAEVEAYEKALADASKPKLKVGDYVKITRELPHYDNDKIYEIVDDVYYGLSVIDEGGYVNNGAIRDGAYEILSLEEVAKQADKAKWAKIGRNPGEIKVGDIAEVIKSPAAHPVGAIVKVTRERSSGSVYAEYGGYTKAYGFEHLRLIAPVEWTFK